MITFIVLIAIITISIIVMKKTSRNKAGKILLIFILTFIACICLIGHTIAYFMKSYDYHIFLEQRNAFEYSLNEARANGNEYETATITKDVAKWNADLKVMQYQNTTAFYDQYIDDRIDDLQMIK